MAKIKTEGTQILSVPYTPEGKLFIEFFRLYVNRHYKVTIRYRGKRGKGEYHDTPKANAEWVAIYVEDKRPENTPHGHWERGWKGGKASIMEELGDFLNIKVEVK